MSKQSHHIALVRQRYTAFGGAERFVDRALSSLKAQNTQLTLICRDWKGEPGYDIHSCRPFYLGRTWRDVSFSHCVQQHITHTAYDLVQSHERIPGCHIYRAGDGVHREWLIQRARVQTPLTARLTRLNLFHRHILAAEKAMFLSPKLRKVICNSHMIKHEIQHHFGLTDDKFCVIHNGVDSDKFHPQLKKHRAQVRHQLQIADDAPVFLFVGSGFERKGAGALIKALAMMQKKTPGAHAIFVGKDKQLAKYQTQAQQHGVSARCHFVGPQQDVRPYYGAADVFVLPTLYEPFPNVVVEAMACGLPVITSSKCGSCDIITPGENGFICDALDIEQLAAHMQTLSSPELQGKMGNQARLTVEPMSLDHMATQLLALYEDLLRTPKDNIQAS